VATRLAAQKSRRKSVEFWRHVAGLTFNAGIAGLVPVILLSTLIFPTVGLTIPGGIVGGLLTVFFFIALIGFVGQTVATQWLTEIDHEHSLLETEKEKLSLQRTRHLEDLHERVLRPLEEGLETASGIGRAPFAFPRDTAAAHPPAGAEASALAHAAASAPHTFAIVGREFRSLDPRPDDPLWQDGLRHFPKLERLSEIQKNTRRLRALAEQLENGVASKLVPSTTFDPNGSPQARAFADLVARRAMGAYLARRMRIAQGMSHGEQIAAATLSAHVEAAACRAELDDLADRIGSLSNRISKTAAGMLPIVRAYRAYHKLDQDCPFTSPSGLHGLLSRLEDEA
jgi:hypothetical protein